MKVAVALSIAILMGAAGDVCLSKGMKSRGEVHIAGFGDILPLIKLVFTTPYVLLGITSMALYFSSYIAALAWVDVSVANPMTALSYVLATGYALLYMRERVTPKRWFGVGLITLGAIFVGLSCR